MEAGKTYREVAEALMQADPTLRPRAAWRHAHGWTQQEVAERVNAALGYADQRITLQRISEAELWPRSGAKPNFTLFPVLAAVYQTSVEQILDGDDKAALLPRELLALDIRVSTGPGPEPATTVERLEMAQMVLIAAQTTACHALESGMTTNTTEMGLADLEEEVRRLAREHLYINSVALLADTLRARDQVYRLLDGQQRPRQRIQLFLFASVLAALIADTSASLGYFDQAADLSRAAYRYADLADHDDMRFWAKGHEANIAHWQGRSRRALDLVGEALTHAHSPLPRLIGENVKATYLATLGKSREARIAIEQAADYRAEIAAPHEFFDDMGGMFTYGQAKQSQVAAIALIEIGDAEATVAEAERALTLYRSFDVTEQAFGNEASAAIDLARARLRLSDMGSVVPTLRPVLDLPAEQRQEWFLERMRALRNELVAIPGGRSTSGKDLQDELEEYISSSANSVASGRYMNLEETNDI